MNAHMAFSRDWDRRLIEMLHSCDAGEKAILTGNSIELNLYSELGEAYRTIGFTNDFP